jgi:3-deoxy-7-phosphoheptulonate synthase
MATVVVSVRPGHDAAVVQAELVARGLWVERLEAGGRVQFVVEPHSQAISREALLGIAGVEAAFAGKPAHPRMDAQAGRAVVVAGVAVGGGAAPVVMAAAAARLAAAGVQLLRGGAFKPRTSPYAFQGHGERALGWLRAAADAHGLAVVTEVMSAEAGPLVAAHADLLQIGSRNMQNYALLAAVARLGRPVLLKRGMSATVEEWLLAGEYLLVGGAPAVILCERGVRSFDPSTRNVLDLGAVALLAHVHRLPVVVDPSHAVGRRDLVPALARAALAAGAAGLLVETHDDAGHALSDGPQALTTHEMQTLMDGLSKDKEAHRG